MVLIWKWIIARLIIQYVWSGTHFARKWIGHHLYQKLVDSTLYGGYFHHNLFQKERKREREKERKRKTEKERKDVYACITLPHRQSISSLFTMKRINKSKWAAPGNHSRRFSQQRERERERERERKREREREREIKMDWNKVNKEKRQEKLNN